MIRHTIKETHNDGVKLKTPISWCGKKIRDWAFSDAQHLALSVNGSIKPCKRCIKAIIRELNKELKD